MRTLAFPMSDDARAAIPGGEINADQVEVFVFVREGKRWLLDDLRRGVEEHGGSTP